MSRPSDTAVGVLLMVASSVFACTGQLLWKLGAQGAGWQIAVGFLLYAVGALLMLVAYRFGELSVLQPILGLSYALSLVLGACWLHERITAGRLLGVAAVIAGVALVARGQARTEA
ncbi:MULTISPECIES: EamA family transporter [unclassified Luteococcus]|uniref:EamA family transporter n=1 Tax=unclassified Luteococcus TaxID=2639923 RepID=UPI00313B8584